MIYLILAITYMSNFEFGIIPNGSACVYNEEYWNNSLAPDYILIDIEVPIFSDKSGIIYYTIFDLKLQQWNFFIGGGIKTYAQKSYYSKNFNPYRTRFNFNLGYQINNFTIIGFNHYCTHTYVDFGDTGIFSGTYEELYFRVELKSK